MKIISANLFSSRRLAPLALGTALLVSGSLGHFANAQTQPNDLRARTQKRIQTLLKSAGSTAQSLNLTAAQKTKMAAIARKNAPQIKAIWSDESLSQAAKISRVRALESQTRAVLTPAQKQKLAQARGEAMGKAFETALWLSNELNLTDTQQMKLKDVVMGSVRKASSSQGNFGSLRSLLLDTNTQVDKVLTPAQQSKWAVIKSTARQEFVKQTRALRQLNRV